MVRGTSKSETNLEHLERNDYIIHKQENKKRMLEDEKAKSLAEKEAAETLAEKARAEKESAEHDKAIAIAEKNVIENAIVRVKSEKIGAWLLHLAKELGHLSTNAVRRIANELTSVADGRYDWRIDRFMRSNGMSR